MYHIERGEPLTCSACGSINAAKRLNTDWIHPTDGPPRQRDVIVCLDCGHEKREPDPARLPEMTAFASIPQAPKPERF